MATATLTKTAAKGGSFLLETPQPSDVFTPADLTDDQKLIGQTAEEFVIKEVLPLVKDLENKKPGLMPELVKKGGEVGLMGGGVPEEYGGAGLDKIATTVLTEKLSIYGGFAVTHGAHAGIGTLPIVYFGTEAQKKKYLPKLATGEWIGAYCLSEPQAGSDAQNSLTRAVLNAEGTHYILNGQKMWITNGGFADVFTIFAKVDGEQFTAFIVERDMGVVSGREEPKLGLDGSSTTALILDNVRVPVENVLGTVGQGHKVAFNILNLGRLKLGTRNIGGAKQALTRAARYAVERHQFGQAIADFGMIKQKLGEMAVRCYVGDAMVYRTLGDVDQALEAVAVTDPERVLKTIEGFAVECSINKVWTSEALAFVVDEALQVYGGYGYSQEFPAERAYRDARITRIYEGTNEINRLIIPTRLLRNAAMSHLWTAESVESALDYPVSPTVSGETLFSAERDLVARAKRLVAFTLGRAQSVYGDALASEQEVLSHIADIIIEVYALESALLRTEKLVAARGEPDCATPVDITRVYASDAADRMEHSARQVVAALADNGEAGSLFAGVRRLASHATFNTVAARRRIADSVIKAGRYYL